MVTQINLFPAAVQRKYESLRRQYLLQDQDNCEETMVAVAKKKKYRSRRQRVSSSIYFAP